jgi:hypothetical protein
VTYTLFRGFVDGGWPQDFTSATRMVPIEASDAFGWAAQAPPPRCAYEGEIVRLQEVEGATLDGWLRPQSDGTWLDYVTGYSFPHTTAFTRADADDALVDGDEEGGWSTEAAGYAWDVSAGQLNPPVFSSSSEGLLVWWQSVIGTAKDTSLLLDLSVGNDRVKVGFNWDDGDVLRATSSNSTDSDITQVGIGPSLDVSRIFLHEDYEILSMLAYGRSTAGAGEVWVDGVASPGASSTSGAAGSSNDWCVINESPVTPVDTTTTAQTRWSGRVDHVTWWSDVGSWSVTAEEAVERLFDAGRLARAGDSMDARFEWLLEASGWGLIGTVDATSVITEQGYRRKTTVLEILQTIEDTEQGRIWVDNDGQLRFSARSWPTSDTVSNTVQATFGDTGTDLPFAAGLSRIVDDDRAIVNVAQVTREGGTMQQVENAASIAAYGRRQPVHLSGLYFSNDKQSRAVADWLVATYGEPTPRVEVLTFHPANEPATLCPFAAEVEPGWLVRVNRDGQTFDAHVVDVGHQIGPTTWEVSLQLDGARAQDLTGFTWDDGTTTVGTPWDDGTGTTSGAKGWVF